MGYWELIEPLWDTLSNFDSPEDFLTAYAAAPEAPRLLFAAHRCESAIRGEDIEEFLCSEIGVLAPEAAQAFRTLGMPQTAALIERAISVFGSTYPRDHNDREQALEVIWQTTGNDGRALFGDLDKAFLTLVESENGGFDEAAYNYALANSQ